MKNIISLKLNKNIKNILIKTKRIINGKKYAYYKLSFDTSYYNIDIRELVRDWLLRETLINEEYHKRIVFTDKITEIHNEALLNIEITNDYNKPFQTFEETLKINKGNSFDFAIYMYVMLSDYINSDKLFICVTKENAFVIIKETNLNNFFMIDNGYYTYKIENMENILPYYNVIPLVIFNHIHYINIETYGYTEKTNRLYKNILSLPEII